MRKRKRDVGNAVVVWKSIWWKMVYSLKCKAYTTLVGEMQKHGHFQKNMGWRIWFKTFKIKTKSNIAYFVAKNDIAYYDLCDLLSAGGTLDKKNCSESILYHGEVRSENIETMS